MTQVEMVSKSLCNLNPYPTHVYKNRRNATDEFQAANMIVVLDS